jgi:hypothetical protein
VTALSIRTLPFVVWVTTAAKRHRTPEEVPNMRYALLIYTAEATEEVPEDQRNAEMAAYGAFTREVTERGAYKGGEALQGTETATTVQVRDGQTITTDGPFAETKEALGGFYLVEAEDLDQAIKIAAMIPGAKHGSIEVRPIWEMPAEYSESNQAVGAAG